MSQQERRDFDSAAKTWDEIPARAELAAAVAKAILQAVPVATDTDVLDYGCGTGLVALNLQPYVRSIVGADTSRGMIDVLEGKISEGSLDNVSTLLLNPDGGGLSDLRPDLIVSSMVLHHVENPQALIHELFRILHPGGFICLADLDAESGDFHDDAAGVFHNGFERSAIENMLSVAGFRGIRVSTVHKIVKLTRESASKEFSVFLFSTQKPG